MSEKTILNVEGMTCSNCALGVTRMLEKKGLRSVNVDFTSGEVVFENTDTSRLPEIKKGINQLGYHVVDHADHSHQENTEKGFSSLEIRFVFCAVLTLPLLLHMISSFHLFHNPYFQFLLCTPVY